MSISAYKTKGYHSQPKFDNLLEDLDISSLKFLNGKYRKEIQSFREQFDLNDEENQKFYKEMLQRKKMIQEDIKIKMMDIYSSPSYQNRKGYFDPETGLVLDEDSNVAYEIAYADDNCSGMVYIKDNDMRIKNTEYEDVSAEDDYEMYKPTDKFELYKEWEYWKEEDDDT